MGSAAVRWVAALAARERIKSKCFMGAFFSYDGIVTVKQFICFFCSLFILQQNGVVNFSYKQDAKRRVAENFQTIVSNFRLSRVIYTS